MSFDQLLSEILAEGVNKFGLDVGIISHINDVIYTVVVCKSDGSIKKGDEFELFQTYCSDVIKDKQTKFYRDVAEITEMLKHPCYLSTQLRAYIGTPVIVDNKIWGTLNYSSQLPHKDIYSAEEIELLASQAQRVASIIAQDERLK
jgi:GAF domain-containing protein